jgi:hypothetical protein
LHTRRRLPCRVRVSTGHDDEQQRLYNSQTLNQALARARMQ